MDGGRGWVSIIVWHTNPVTSVRPPGAAGPASFQWEGRSSLTSWEWSGVTLDPAARKGGVRRVSGESQKGDKK